MNDFIKMLLEIGHKHSYNDGERLFLEGEMPRKLMLLFVGKVAIYKLNKDDKDEILHTLSAPSFIAEMPTFRAQPYPASCVACGKIEVIEIGLKVFEKCLENRDFSKEFIASLCHKISILEQYIVTRHKSIEARLAQYLLINEENLYRISQRQIAAQINTTPQSLSRNIRLLKNQAVIASSKGKIRIINREFLLGLLR